MARVQDGTTAGGFSCDASGCDLVGVYAPCIMTPFEGFPTQVRAPIMSQVDIHVCPKHTKAVRLDDLLATKGLRESVEEATAAKGGRPAFARSYIEFVRCHSPEFLEFQQRAGLVPPDDAVVRGSITLP